MQVFLTSFCIFVSKSFHIYTSKTNLRNQYSVQYSYHSLKPLPAPNTLYHTIPFSFHYTTPHTTLTTLQTYPLFKQTIIIITPFYPSQHLLSITFIQILSTKCLCIKYLLTILSHLAKTTLRKEIHRSIVLLTIHSHDPTRTWAITSTLTT